MEKRPIRIEGEIGYVPLPDGTEATIDAEDAELVGQYNWRISRYVITDLPKVNEKSRMLYLHRLVMGAPESLEVDHRNGDPRVNQKEFLRVATRAENGKNQKLSSANTSGHKGVSWHKARKKWQAKIKHEGKTINLGRFTDPKEAAKAYREAAIRLHGEFANFG